MAEWVEPYADMIFYCAATGGEKPLPSLMAEAALQPLGRIDLYGATLSCPARQKVEPALTASRPEHHSDNVSVLSIQQAQSPNQRSRAPPSPGYMERPDRL